MKLKEIKLMEWTQKIKDWNHKMKKWKMKSYPLSKKDIAYRILPTPTKIDKRANWRPMGWNNLLVGSHALCNVTKSYVYHTLSIRELLC